MWCIADKWDAIIQTIPQKFKWFNDMSVGAAWSKYWLNTFKNEKKREKQFSNEVGFEVWFYSDDVYQYFMEWLPTYILRREAEESTPHKSTKPVLPTVGLKKCDRYVGKRAYFSGFYPEDKKTIFGLLESQIGVIPLETFSTKAEFLILGPNAGHSKIAKANEKGIVCVTVEIFCDEITENPANA